MAIPRPGSAPRVDRAGSGRGVFHDLVCRVLDRVPVANLAASATERAGPLRPGVRHVLDTPRDGGGDSDSPSSTRSWSGTGRVCTPAPLLGVVATRRALPRRPRAGVALGHWYTTKAAVGGAGLSAMPSLHVAMAELCAIVGRASGTRVLAYALTSFSILIFVGWCISSPITRSTATPPFWASHLVGRRAVGRREPRCRE